MITLGLFPSLQQERMKLEHGPLIRGLLQRKQQEKFTDIEKGFIRAEVCKFDYLKEHGSMAKVKEKDLQD